MTRVYEALAAGLRAEGVETVFCLLGDGNLDVLVELADRHGVRLVHARHEQGATAMADGYSRRSGRIGVCSVTHGPGLTQTATSLKVAVEHRSRLLMLAGDTPTTDPAHVQGFPQGEFVTALGAAAVPLRAPGRWDADLREAVQRAAAGQPTVLMAPTDYQMTAATERAYDAAGDAPAPTAAAESGLAAAASALDAALAPVIVAGRGALGADTAVATLAERLGAGVVITLGAKGFLADHPLQRGLIGGLGEPRAHRALMGADCILAVGASLNPWSTKGGRLVREAPVIQIDADPRAFDRFAPCSVRLLGDAGATLLRLTDLTEHRPRPPRFDDVPPPDQPPAEGYADAETGVDPRRAFRALDASLPADRALVLDGGHFITFACTALSVTAPERFLFSCDFATVGQGLAMAVGACVAAPEERTTLIVGDGGLLMSIAELDTAVRYALPLNVVVINDGAYGQEVHSLAAKGLRSDHAIFAVPDLASLAQGFGAQGHLVREPQDLERLPQLLTEPGGPRVIDIRVNRAVVSEAADEIFQQVRESVPA